MTAWRVRKKDGLYKAQIACWGCWWTLSAQGYVPELWPTEGEAIHAAIAAAQAREKQRRNRWLLWRTVKSGVTE